jgi:uncharacterized membrane protein
MRLVKYWDRVRTSLWFVPALMVVAAIALALAAITADEGLAGRDWRSWGWAYTGSAEGASAVLGAIAGSMITIAGVVFSLTLIALQLASSQFGPRLLRNFMRDTTNQLVIGTFVSTFLYCLLVLRAIRREDVHPFVPHLSVTLGVLLALASLGVLIYFIHHVAVSIQADEVVARVAQELMVGIDRLYPMQIGEGGPAAPSPERLPEAFEAEARPVPAVGNGYLQLVDADGLMALARRADAIIRVERRPGHYVVAGTPLALVWPGARANARLADQLRSAFILGEQRTPVQDVEFSVNQIAEVAVRALSPGVNDPFTAIACLDRLGAALSRLAEREIPSAHRRDGDGQLRVVAPPVTFPAIVAAALDPIRRYGRSDASVTLRLLDTIGVVAGAARRPEDRRALAGHAEVIVRGARDGLPAEADVRAVEERYAAVSRLLRDAAPAG